MNDADIEQARYEEKAHQTSRLRKRGICTHGSSIGSRPCVCRDCGKEFASFEDMVNERHELLA